MNGLGKVFAVVFIWLATSVAWLVLGGVMHSRAGASARDISSRVEGLWGRAQLQRAPTATVVPALATEPAAVTDASQPSVVPAPTMLPPTSTDLDVTLTLDQRLKGLRWFSLYDVALDGKWTFKNEADEARTIRVVFPLPDAQGVYDDLRFVVNGEAIEVVPEQGQLVHQATLEAGETLDLEAGYASRGMDDWRYEPSVGGAVSVLRDFSLRLHTNFSDVDFPQGTLSPSTRTPDGAGEHLTWSFSRIVTGAGIGTTTPVRVQPGELASALSFSAPISLGFFFLVIAVLARLRKLDIHPINYMGIGGAFFAFHLLFSYSVDHLHVGAAFALASVTSVVMVTAYLRLVVSARFAFIESAAAQLVYLVGFSLAHFLEGLTGLTVTILSIATLFLLMMLTGRIQWSKVLARPNARDRIGAPPPYGSEQVPSAVAIMDGRMAAAGPSPQAPYGHGG
jgi:inner membrane protein involved in colicin E2 resistance